MLIGLTGKKRSGKDSVAQTLVSRFGFQRVAFADPLKESALAVNPLIGDGGLRLRDYVESVGWEKAKEANEVRRFLQNFGVGIRELDSDFWVDAAFAKIDGPGRFVITDVRFPNEAQAVLDALGYVVRVERPGLDSTDTHVSETALDDFEPDRVIVNDGDLDDLAREAEALVWTLSQ